MANKLTVKQPQGTVQWENKEMLLEVFMYKFKHLIKYVYCTQFIGNTLRRYVYFPKTNSYKTLKSAWGNREWIHSADWRMGTVKSIEMEESHV